MMRLAVVIAILSVLFIGRSNVFAQGSESAKNPEVKDAQKKDGADKKTDAAKQAFDEKMEGKEAELKAMSDDDPEKKAKFKAQMEQERKEYKEQVKAKEWEEKEKKNAAGGKGAQDMDENVTDDVDGKNATMGTKTVDSPASNDQVQSEVKTSKEGAMGMEKTKTSAKEGTKGVEKTKTSAKEGKNKEAKQTKTKTGKKDAS